MIKWFLNWSIGWAEFLGGFIRVISFNLLKPDWFMDMAKIYSRYCFYHNK